LGQLLFAVEDSRTNVLGRGVRGVEPRSVAEKMSVVLIAIIKSAMTSLSKSDNPLSMN
jgi:hypothetical protein